MYLLDANVFIQAKNLHYGFDFCPAFWDWIDAQAQVSKVASIDRVRQELETRDDPLSRWIKARKAPLFLEPDRAVLDAVRVVADWAVNQPGEPRFSPNAVSEFLSVADSFLVAHAMAKNAVLVTHEVRSNQIKKIKIPNACENFKVRCINPFEMLRQEKALFVLR